LESLLTVVLPVHNAERTLRPAVCQILDLFETLPRRLRLVLVDDGSTDGTFEAACELASQFPQLRVIRQPYQRGLGSALSEVRRRFDVGDIVAHDGVGPIDADQRLASLCASGASRGGEATGAEDARGSRRIHSAAGRSSHLAGAHPSPAPCHWMRFQEPAPPRRTADSLRREAPGVAPTAPAFAMSANTCTSALVLQ
jgi:hypothetical protein